MSIEKALEEAKRWLKTARDDLDTANILKENSKFQCKLQTHQNIQMPEIIIYSTSSICSCTVVCITFSTQLKKLSTQGVLR